MNCTHRGGMRTEGRFTVLASGTCTAPWKFTANRAADEASIRYLAIAFRAFGNLCRCIKTAQRWELENIRRRRAESKTRGY